MPNKPLWITSDLARRAGGLCLVAALAGCIDATVDVTVLSATEARVELTQTLSADFYAMAEARAGEGTGEAGFCPGGELTENDDGSATCVIVDEGSLDELMLGDNAETGFSIAPAGPGQVRVGFDMSTISDGIDDSVRDAETLALVEAMFSGRTLTLIVAGGDIVDTNMERVEGAARLVVPLLELITGEADLPDEVFAVVAP